MDTYTVEQTSAATTNAPARRTPRRLRSADEKRKIVEETLQSGTSVAAVAQRHAVNANLLFSWRRQYVQGALADRTRPPRAPKLLPVAVSAAPAATSSPTSPGTIEIELPCGARVRLLGDVTAERLVLVLSALAQR